MDVTFREMIDSNKGTRSAPQYIRSAAQYICKCTPPDGCGIEMMIKEDRSAFYHSVKEACLAIPSDRYFTLSKTRTRDRIPLM